MRILIVLSLLLFSSLNALTKSNEALPMADRAAGASSLVNGCVNAISGNYLDRTIDLSIVGPEPINFERYHCSFDQYSCSLWPTWGHNYNSFIYLSNEPVDGKSTSVCFLKDINGGTSFFSTPWREDKDQLMSFNKNLPENKGFTNLGGATLHASSTPANSTIFRKKKSKFAVLKTGDGGFKAYQSYKDSESNVFFKIRSERKPNGNKIVYDQDEKKPSMLDLLNVRTTNAQDKLLSNLKFHVKSLEDFINDPTIVIEGSNGQKCIYRFMKQYADKKTKLQFFLVEVESPLHPKENYEYDFQKNNKLIGKIKAKRRPNGRFLLTEYYENGMNRFSEGDCTLVPISSVDDPRINRVKVQKAPLGTDATPIVSHRYFYDLHQTRNAKGVIIDYGRTDVYDAYSNRTSYFFDGESRLSSIAKYTVNDGSQCYSNELFFWGGKWTNEEGCLTNQRLVDGKTGKIVHERIYTYDARANVIGDTFVGNLTGGSEYPNESILQEFTYSNDESNLLLTENDFLTKTLYSYQPGTNLVTAKFMSKDGTIIKREFYGYDENALVIVKIVDDGITNDINNLTGVTERFITRTIRSTQYPQIGLPIQEEKTYLDIKTGEIILLQKKTTSYTKEGRPHRQSIYDSQNILSYTLVWEYDSMGNVIMEQNPLGHVTRRQFVDGNLVWEQGPNVTYEKRYHYDYCDRRIKTETIHQDGKHFVNHYRYNYLHQCVASTDLHGNETLYTYDIAGNVIKKVNPAVVNQDGVVYQPEERFEYDVEGNLITEVNAAGGVTRKRYNARGKEAYVEYPDGTVESMRYNHWGMLVEAIAKNGTKTCYEYDYQKRVLKEEAFDPDGNLLKVTTNTYNANHLLSSIDPDGIVTTYTYDGAGRELIVKRGDSLTSFEYDSLGRKHKIFQQYGDDPTQYTVLVKAYDYLDQIIEERTEDFGGNILLKTSYGYDVDGNQTIVIKYTAEGNSVTQTEYNDLKLPTKITNGLQEISYIFYNFDYINQLGQKGQQRTTVDPKGNKLITTLDVQGRTVLSVKCNAFGDVLSRQEIFYDSLGNAVKTVETVVTPDQLNRVVINTWSYNHAGNKLEQIEALGRPEQKITRYCYSSSGELAEIIKSDGIILYHTYNALGLLEKFHSSDQSFSYLYTYNPGGKPIAILDEIDKSLTDRFYDTNGRLTSETLGNGVTLRYAYDRMDRPTQVLLPDNSAINYQYDALHLRQVEHKGYVHEYLSYDLAGSLLEENLCDKSRVYYSCDLLGRIKKVDSKVIQSADYIYDECGNLLGYSTEGKSSRFAYDDLYQLKEEEGHEHHEYTNDSLYNRVKKDGHCYQVNALNQVINDGINDYEYGQNGNLIAQNGINDYEYDQNGNLIAQRGEKKLIYKYDALDRLIRIEKEEGAVAYKYDSFNRRIS